MSLIRKITSLTTGLSLLLCLFSFQNGIAETEHSSQIKALKDQLGKLSEHSQGREYAQLSYELGCLYFDVEDYVTANQYFCRVGDLDRKITAGRLGADNQYKIGESFFWQSHYDSAAIHLLVALVVFPDILTSADSTKILKRIGDSYSYMGDLRQSHTYKFQGIEILLKEGGDKNKADAFYSLGEIYYEEDNYSAAIEKLEAAILLYERVGDISDISYCEDLLANVYFEMKDFEKSLDYRLRSSDEKYGLISAYERGHAKHSIAEAYLALEDYEKALPLLLEALRIRENSNQKEESILTGLALANWYILNGNCKKGMKMFKRYLQKAKKLQVQPVLQKAFKELSEASSRCGDFKAAIAYKDKYILLKDSLSDVRTKIQVANLGAIYELKERNQQMAVLQKENQVTQLYMFLAIGFILILLLAGFMGYLMFSQKSLHSEVLEKKNEKIEDQFAIISAANDKLERVNKDLEQFAYIVSHDLKAPLNTIGSYTSLLKRRYTDSFDQSGQEFMAFITDGVKHMGNLLDDVLLYSKSKNDEIELKSLSLKDLIEKVLFALESNINEKEAVIIKEFTGTVMGNSTQLFQLIQNLIENALKFIPKDRKPIIEIKTKKIGDRIQIEIKDNGIGIPKESQEKIFQPFQRLHSISAYKGTGVGLAICQRIVEKHQGKIGLCSDGLAGTTFYFTLLDANQSKEEPVFEEEKEMEDLIFSD